jgi:hypothetical protein
VVRVPYQETWYVTKLGRFTPYLKTAYRASGHVLQQNITQNLLGIIRSTIFDIEEDCHKVTESLSVYPRLTYLKERKKKENERFEILTAVFMKSSIFWNTTLGLPPAFTQVFCLAYSTLKMEAICSSETSVDIQRTTRCYTSVP